MKKFIVILAMLVMLLTACTKNVNVKLNKSGADLSSYPIETDVTLTYFRPIPNNLLTVVENYAETEFAKEFEKRTGVEIKYMHPAAGQVNEAVSLMIASNELPDIIEHPWINYPGGPVKALDEGIIIPLNDYKKYAPALFGLLEANPEWDKAAKTDDGVYYSFPNIQGDPKLLMTKGPVIRNDWLVDLGIPQPETIDDWQAMLTAFRDKKGATAPFSYTSADTPLVLSMFGVHNGNYVENGVVKSSFLQPELKEALIILNDWFNKGLLDKNIVSVDSKALDSQILTGQTGATIASGGTGIGQYMHSAASKNQNFDLAGVKFPTYERGKNNSSMPIGIPITGFSCTAITSACKHPEIAAKVLDYLYTEEGHIFANFGVENLTYTMENGFPTYTDLIMNNPDGLTVSHALGRYVRAGSTSAYVTDVRYIEQYYKLPQQKAALEAWQLGYNESLQHRIPPITLSSDETEEYSLISNEVSKYASQMRTKFITGIEPISKWDEYVETLKKLGLERAMEIRTQALKRYNNR